MSRRCFGAVCGGGRSRFVKTRCACGGRGTIRFGKVEGKSMGLLAERVGSEERQHAPPPATTRAPPGPYVWTGWCGDLKTA